MQIRKLEPADATELLQLFRCAITEEPLAFVTSPEDEIASSVEALRERLTAAPDLVIFGAVSQALVGMLWFTRESRPKLAHQALISNVFVRKEFRGRGIAKNLLSAAIAYARTLNGVDSLWLGVSDRSPAARRFYERHGFMTWGTEPDVIRANGESARMHYMGMRLE